MGRADPMTAPNSAPGVGEASSGWDREVCTGCSSSLSVDDIKRGGFVSCCPDRRMVPVRDLVDAYESALSRPQPVRPTREEIARVVNDAITGYENSPIPEPWDARRSASNLAADAILALFDSPLGDQPTDLGSFRASPSIPTEREDGPGVGWRRFYLDCEFDGHDGPLLSLALVRDDGESIHIRADVEPMDLWVRQNVLPIMDEHQADESATVYLNHVGRVVRQFIGDCDQPVIVADSPVDIGRFCRALSTGPDGGWASADYPEMRFEVHNVDCYPTTLVGAVQHNAWWDAMALRERLRSTTASAVGTERSGVHQTPSASPSPEGGR